MQIAPTGSLLAILTTFLLGALLYGVTAHIAARYVLGDVAVHRAFLVGLGPATTTLILDQYSIGVIVPVAIAVDFLLIRVVYRTGNRPAALITIVHYSITILLLIALRGLVTIAS